MMDDRREQLAKASARMQRDLEDNYGVPTGQAIDLSAQWAVELYG